MDLARARAFNATIFSKLTWMGRQLRHTDNQSLMSWVNAIHHVKSLLILIPSADAIQPPTYQPSTTQSTSHIPWQPPLINCVYPPGFSKPRHSSTLPQVHTASKTPTPDKPTHHICTPWLSQSPCLKLDYYPNPDTELLKDKPFTSVQQHQAGPTQPSKTTKPCPPLSPNCTKDTHETTNDVSRQLTTCSIKNKKSPLPGMHIWEVTSPLNPMLFTWSYDKRDGGKEYKILKAPLDKDEWFTVQLLRTGKVLQMRLLEEDRLEP